MKFSQIETIRPVLLNCDIIQSWFTLRNQENHNVNAKIPGLNLGFNTLDESSTIKSNRELLSKELGLESDYIVYADQVHGSGVKIVNNGGIIPETDALVTDRRGITLAIQVADCTAVLFGDTKNQVVAAAHAGWRGAGANIVSKTIQKMISLGAETDHIKVFLSPCISFNNFEVGEEVARQFPDEFVDRITFQKPHIDLKNFIRKQLLDSGIIASNIEIDASCTIDSENFYSYRRQKEKSGRMMGIITLKK